MTKPLPIIIDTDPGQDDAVAILLALASPEFEVLGITAVAGIVPLALTEKNSRKICELAGKPETKVFAGAIRPMIRPLVKLCCSPMTDSAAPQPASTSLGVTNSRQVSASIMA